MDIPRQRVARKKLIRRIAYLVGASTVVLLIGLGTSRLKPAAPAVERSTIWTDTVKRGPMLRQVRGPGALVRGDTVLVVLRNPELDQAVLAEASHKAAKEKLDSEIRLFQTGESTNFLVLTRQNEYADSSLRAVAAHLGFNKAVARLERALGTTLRSHEVKLK